MRYCSKWSLARSGVGGLTMKVELVINSDQIALTFKFYFATSQTVSNLYNRHRWGCACAVVYHFCPRGALKCA